MTNAANQERDLLTTAERYLRQFDAHTVVDFDISGLDGTGIPAWCATAFLADGSALHGYGFGATSARARVGALGELSEQYRSRVTTRALPHRTASYNALEDFEPGQAVDPRSLGLSAGSSYSHDDPLSWVSAFDMATGAERLVPIEWAASSTLDIPEPLRNRQLLVTPVTNGLGAGTSLAMSREHGVLEVLQRDGNGLSIRALDRGVVVDVDLSADLPGLSSVHRQLAAAGIDVTVKLTSTDFGLTGVCVVGRATADDLVIATACGEAVHSCRDVAITKAVYEYAGARARKAAMHGSLDELDRVAPPGYVELCISSANASNEEDRLLTSMRSWIEQDAAPVFAELERTVFAERDRVAYRDLPSSATPSAEVLPLLTERLAAESFRPLEVDLSGGGIHVTKTLVPGLEVETVAYHRITARNFARLALLVPSATAEGTRPSGRHWEAVRDPLEGPSPTRWIDTAALMELTGQLLPLYREPEDHAVQIALGRYQIKESR